jgi:hypothetical protein
VRLKPECACAGTFSTCVGVVIERDDFFIFSNCPCCGGARLCQVRPYRHPGLQRLATLLALVRACVLGLSVAFIPSAASDDESDVLIVGYVVAALHMVSTVGLALLCALKAYRTYRGIHSSGNVDEKSVVLVRCLREGCLRSGVGPEFRACSAILHV